MSKVNMRFMSKVVKQFLRDMTSTPAKKQTKDMNEQFTGKTKKQTSI